MNINFARQVLANPSGATGKNRSDLKLLGFMREGSLTDLGRRAAQARSNQQVASLWCQWLQRTSDAELEEINTKLLIAKRLFSQFWRLREDVRNYFLDNADRSPRRGNLRTLLQTIELLCNARDVVQELTLDEIQTLSRLLGERSSLPEFVRPEVEGYFDNKGTRRWDTDDRRVVPDSLARGSDRALIIVIERMLLASSHGRCALLFALVAPTHLAALSFTNAKRK